MQNFSLFIDTSRTLKLGLLDQNFEFVAFEEYPDQKCGDIIHHKINNLLVEANCNLLSLKNCFFLMGPGSYTGLRFTQGIMDLFTMEGINCYSFYWFDLPWLVEGQINDKYLFTTNAFKGESLVLWIEQGEILGQKLVRNKDIHQVENPDNARMWEIERDLESYFTNHSQAIFKNVKESQMQKPIYYFRSDLEEFTPSL